MFLAVSAFRGGSSVWGWWLFGVCLSLQVWCVFNAAASLCFWCGLCVRCCLFPLFAGWWLFVVAGLGGSLVLFAAGLLAGCFGFGRRLWLSFQVGWLLLGACLAWLRCMPRLPGLLVAKLTLSPNSTLQRSLALGFLNGEVASSTDCWQAAKAHRLCRSGAKS